MSFRIWNSQPNRSPLSLCLSIAVLSLAKGAMLSGATCAVLCSRDCKRLGVPALAEHCVPRPEAREHSLGFTRTHNPDWLRPVQREHRTQWNNINILWNTRGKRCALLLVDNGCFQTMPLHLQSICELVLMFLYFFLQYLAPEVLHKQPYDRTVDWWCLGAVLYEMLYGLVSYFSTINALHA